MSSEQGQINIIEFLAGDEHSPQMHEQVKHAICCDSDLRRELANAAEALADDPEALGVKLSKSKATGGRGIALWLLGNLEDAEKALSEAASDGGVEYELGCCRLELGLYDAAIEAFKDISKSDPRHDDVVLLMAEADTKAGRSDKSFEVLQEVIRTNPSPAAYYQLGLACAAEGNQVDAVQSYEKALEIDPDYAPATFRLGYAYVLAGDADAAIGHYNRLAEHSPLYPNALVNLGVLYEDTGQLKKAMACYRRVLKACPTHSRAKLYLADAVAASDMFYDPEEQKERTRKDEILNIPITDFELSVRSRNCLAKMNIRTLGDLVGKTEEELLSYKNFGETSLQEIKEMLVCKGLRLGGEREEDEWETAVEPLMPPDADDFSDDDDLLNQPPEHLQLSVRCRKCIERLNLSTIGELTQITEDELMSVRNFGRTSLDEIKAKLAAHGLSLSDGNQRGS